MRQLFFPKSRRLIPSISRELLLALIPHRHGYKAHSLPSISPLLPPSQYAARPPHCFAGVLSCRRVPSPIPRSPVSPCLPSLLGSLPRVALRLLTPSLLARVHCRAKSTPLRRARAAASSSASHSGETPTRLDPLPAPSASPCPDRKSVV